MLDSPKLSMLEPLYRGDAHNGHGFRFPPLALR